MADFPANSDITNDNLTTANFRTWLSNLLAAAKQLPGGDTPTTLTINAGRIIPTGPFHFVAPQSGTADTLESIDTTYMRNHSWLLLLRANIGDTITVASNAVSGDGRIDLANSTDFELGKYNEALLLRREGSFWYEIALRSFDNPFVDIGITIVSATGTFTVPDGVRKLLYTVIPTGGGGGGGAGVNTLGTYAAGTAGTAGGNIVLTEWGVTVLGGVGGNAASSARGGAGQGTNDQHGGDAFGQSGGRGGSGIKFRNQYGGGGRGGAGASSTITGVDGGGGGASGGAGVIVGPVERNVTPGEVVNVTVGAQGTGGAGGTGTHSNGSAGTDGGPGCVIFQYQ